MLEHRFGNLEALHNLLNLLAFVLRPSSNKVGSTTNTSCSFPTSKQFPAGFSEVTLRLGGRYQILGDVIKQFLVAAIS